jgi:hypothetical protein
MLFKPLTPSRDDGPFIYPLQAFELVATDLQHRRVPLAKGKRVTVRNAWIQAERISDVEIGLFHLDRETGKWEQRQTLGKNPWQLPNGTPLELDDTGAWVLSPVDPPAGCVEGRVVDDKGRRVAGALIEAVRAPNSFDEYVLRDEQHATSDAQGYFLIRLAAGASHAIAAVHSEQMSRPVLVHAKHDKGSESSCTSAGDLTLGALEREVRPQRVLAFGIKSCESAFGCGFRCDELKACAADEWCINNECAEIICPDGKSRCDLPSQGSVACADLSTDRLHCGACGSACASGEECVEGLCTAATCADGWTLCADGCRELATDLENCGSCANECAQGSACVEGQCECPEGLVIAQHRGDWKTSCVDPTSDLLACGSELAFCRSFGCENGQCTDAEPACAMLKAFEAGIELGETCRDADSDPWDCGGTGESCSVIQGGMCVAGECVCSNSSLCSSHLCLYPETADEPCEQ